MNFRLLKDGAQRQSPLYVARSVGPEQAKQICENCMVGGEEGYLGVFCNSFRQVRPEITGVPFGISPEISTREKQLVNQVLVNTCGIQI